MSIGDWVTSAQDVKIKEQFNTHTASGFLPSNQTVLETIYRNNRFADLYFSDNSAFNYKNSFTDTKSDYCVIKYS